MSTAMPSVVKLIRDMWAKTGMSELVINWVRLVQNGEKSGIFKISFQYILALHTYQHGFAVEAGVYVLSA